MNKQWIAALLVVVMIFSAPMYEIGLVYAKGQNEKKPDRDQVEILVQYKEAHQGEVTRTKVKNKLKNTKLDVRKRLSRSKLDILEIGSTDDLMKTIAELKKDPNVEFVQPNYELSINAAVSDARFNEQWGLANTGILGGVEGTDIAAIEAWTSTLGQTSTVVGVLDTGIDIQHPDLQGSIYTNTAEIPNNGIDDDSNGYIDDTHGWDFANEDNSVFDNITDDTHGTHVAGIIAAQANTIGIRGVAPGVTILPLKFLNGVSGYTSDAIEAIEYAKQMGVSIINASFGGPNNNPALDAAMSASGILFVVSAGNDGKNTAQSPIYPAASSLPNILSVAAIDNKGNLASVSNYGSSVDVAAPGVGIISTLPDERYGLMTGTSMAAPFVTGLAALIKSQFPVMTVSQIAERIQANVTKSKSLQGKVASGGYIHAAKALISETEVLLEEETTSNNPSNTDDEDTMVVSLAAAVSAQLIEQIHYGEEGVNVATGNFSTSATDLSITSPGFTVNISRTYNSKDERQTSTMGRGWTFGFEGSLKDDTTYPSLLKVAKLPNGQAQVFEKVGALYTANDSHSTLVKQADNTHILTTSDQYSYGFNTSGWLEWMKDRNGNKVTISFDTSGKISQITDTVGRIYTVGYTGSYLTSVTDPIGRIVSYQYDASNSLWKVTDAMNQLTAQYEYDAQGYLTKISDGQGNVQENIITDHTAGVNIHKVSQYKNKLGNVQNFIYDTTNRKTTITDAAGRSIVKWYDLQMYVTKSQDPEGKLTLVEYYTDANDINKFGEEKLITDRNGNKTEYVRDNNGNIKKMINPDLSYKSYEYDSKNNLISEIDELGKATYYIFDTNKINVLQKVQPLNGTDVYSVTADQSKFAITRYAYYTNSETTQLGYKASGLLKHEIDPEGHKTTNTYDGFGNKNTVIYPSGDVMTYTYNKIGWLISSLTPEGYRTDYSYDKNGLLLRTITDQGETSFTEYDVKGNKVQEVSPNQYKALDDGLNDVVPSYVYRDNGVGYRYEYYPNGQLKNVTDPMNNVSQYTYDVYGNILTETRANGSVFVNEYDVMNRMSKGLYKEDMNAIPKQLSAYAYTTLTNGLTQKKETRYLNESDTALTVWTYDALGNEIEKQNPDGGVTSVDYLANGLVGSSTDARGNTTYARYDGLNRATDTWSPLYNGTYMYSGVTYDKNGRSVAEISGKDPISLFSVPVKDRTTIKSYAYGADGELNAVTTSAGGKTLYSYNRDGQLIREETYTSDSESVVKSYERDALGRITAEQHHVNAEDIYGHASAKGQVIELEIRYQYDNNGNVLKEVLPDGTTSSFVYDVLNRQLSTKKTGLDEQGLPTLITTSATYTWDGQPLTVTDANGNVTTNEYNKRGSLIRVVNAAGGVTAYDYDRSERRIVEVTPNNYDAGKPLSALSRTEFTYDQMDRVKAVTDKFNAKKLNATTFTWSDQWTETVTNAYQYDLQGNVIKELNGEGYLAGVGTTIDARISSGYGTTHTYNDANYLATSLDPVSRQRNLPFAKRIEYDGKGRYVAVIDASGAITRTSYDDAGNVSQVSKAKTSISPEQIGQSNSYDLAGRMLTRTDANGNTTAYEYNALGQARKVTYDGDVSMPALVVTSLYDRRARVVEQISSDGSVNRLAYDQEGRVINQSEQKLDGTEAITSSSSYDKMGNQRFAIDANGTTTTYVYNNLNRLTETRVTVTGVNGVAKEQVTTITYDKNGNKLTEKDWRNNIFTYVYDAKNRLVEKIDPKGISLQKLAYNANDAQVKSVDALNQVTVFTFDRNNRQLSTTDPVGNQTSQSYTDTGSVYSQVDGKGNTTTYTYDHFNRLTSVINALNETTAYTYDLNGNMLSQTDGKGQTTSFEYNVQNKQVRKIDHDGRSGQAGSYTYVNAKVESYTYNSDGTMATKIDRNGQVTTYTYDVHGRLLSQTVGEVNTQKPDNSISYTYDNNGNQQSMTDSTGTTRRTYDEFNETISKYVPQLGTNTYLVDQTTGVISGNYSEMTTDVKGNVTTKVYDHVGRLIEVKADNGSPVVYTYYSNGNRKSVAYPNGSKEEYTYNKNNQVESLKNYQGATLLDSYTYTYDSAGNQRTKDEYIQGTNKGLTTYNYDALNRLQSVSEPGGKVTSYTYDKAGNRTMEKVTVASTVKTTYYEYNEQNRLMKTIENKTGNAIEFISYAYDNNGNMTSKNSEQIKKVDPMNPPEPTFGLFIYGQENDNPRIDDVIAGQVSYTYNVWNQMIQSTTATHILTYTYNGEGRRISKKANGEITQYVYEYDKVVLETDGKGKQTARNLYGTNLLSRTLSSDTVYYLYNAHGDVTSLMDITGKLRSTFDYDAFGTPIDSAIRYYDQTGNITTGAGKIDSPIRYSGYQYDTESGLYYLNARYYDSKIARFLSEDTYRGRANDPLSLNLYTYAVNNPIQYFDPTGHAPIDANQKLYLTNLANSNSGAASWAKAELQKANQELYLTNLVTSGSKGEAAWAKQELAKTVTPTPVSSVGSASSSPIKPSGASSSSTSSSSSSSTSSSPSKNIASQITIVADANKPSDKIDKPVSILSQSCNNSGYNGEYCGNSFVYEQLTFMGEAWHAADGDSKMQRQIHATAEYLRKLAKSGANYAIVSLDTFLPVNIGTDPRGDSYKGNGELREFKVNDIHNVKTLQYGVVNLDYNAVVGFNYVSITEQVNDKGKVIDSKRDSNGSMTWTERNLGGEGDSNYTKIIAHTSARNELSALSPTLDYTVILEITDKEEVYVYANTDKFPSYEGYISINGGEFNTLFNLKADDWGTDKLPRDGILFTKVNNKFYNLYNSRDEAYRNTFIYQR